MDAYGIWVLNPIFHHSTHSSQVHLQWAPTRTWTDEEDPIKARLACEVRAHVAVLCGILAAAMALQGAKFDLSTTNHVLHMI